MTSRQDNPTSPSGGGEEPLVVTRHPHWELWKLRSHTLRLMAGDAAKALGISVHDLQDLEESRATCDWAEASRRLRAYAAARTAHPAATGGGEETP